MTHADRIALHVAAARRANHLAIRFFRKGDRFNARQARILAIRAINTARQLAKGE